jgi:hypothetical protein
MPAHAGIQEGVGRGSDRSHKCLIESGDCVASLAIFDSCGHCEEPEATRQSPSTEAVPALLSVIPAPPPRGGKLRGDDASIRPVDSCLRRNDGLLGMTAFVG